jgi:hypothetical protein
MAEYGTHHVRTVAGNQYECIIRHENKEESIAAITITKVIDGPKEIGAKIGVNSWELTPLADYYKFQNRTEEVWEYEYDVLASEPDAELEEGEPSTFWIEEDDERSASWKALGKGGTGNIRSYTRTITFSPRTVKQGMTEAELRRR